MKKKHKEIKKSLLGGLTAKKPSACLRKCEKASFLIIKKKSAGFGLYVRSDFSVVKMNVSPLKSRCWSQRFWKDNGDLFRKGYCMKRNQIVRNPSLRRKSPIPLWVCFVSVFELETFACQRSMVSGDCPVSRKQYK